MDAFTPVASPTAQALHMPPARPLLARCRPPVCRPMASKISSQTVCSARLARGLPAGSTYVSQGGTAVGMDVNNERGHAKLAQYRIPLFPVARQL